MDSSFNGGGVEWSGGGSGVPEIYDHLITNYCDYYHYYYNYNYSHCSRMGSTAPCSANGLNGNIVSYFLFSSITLHCIAWRRRAREQIAIAINFTIPIFTPTHFSIFLLPSLLRETTPRRQKPSKFTPNSTHSHSLA